MFHGRTRLGTTLVRGKVGATQGSPISPFGCNVVLVYLEVRQWNLFIASGRWITKFACRWVDDLCMRITLWSNPHIRSYDAHVVSRSLHCLISQVESVYTAWFGIKVEDANVFVGFNVTTPFSTTTIAIRGFC